MSDVNDPQKGPITAYAAGGLFTQFELAGNVLLKDAIWRLSGGRFCLFLPQSREARQLKIPDIKAHIRNTDLLGVVESDILLANFDGLDLDSGTVVEFIFAKMLGKPAVILRTDFRRQYSTGLSEPFNLMVKNWPRSLEIMLDSFVVNANLVDAARKCQPEDTTSSLLMEAEMTAVQHAMEQTAGKVIDAMEEVVRMENPYPPDLREEVYRTARLSPGHGFDELVNEKKLDEIIQRLKDNGTF